MYRCSLSVWRLVSSSFPLPSAAEGAVGLSAALDVKPCAWAETQMSKKHQRQLFDAAFQAAPGPGSSRWVYCSKQDPVGGKSSTTTWQHMVKWHHCTSCVEKLLCNHDIKEAKAPELSVSLSAYERRSHKGRE